MDYAESRLSEGSEIIRREVNIVPNEPVLSSIAPVTAVTTQHYHEGVDVRDDYRPARSHDPREFSYSRPRVGAVGSASAQVARSILPSDKGIAVRSAVSNRPVGTFAVATSNISGVESMPVTRWPNEARYAASFRSRRQHRVLRRLGNVQEARAQRALQQVAQGCRSCRR